MKSLNRQYSQGSQSMNFIELLELGPHKLKISIKSDTYKAQSHAQIFRWTGDEWKLLHYVHHGQMQTPTNLCYLPDEKRHDPSPCMADRETLIGFAKNILY